MRGKVYAILTACLFLLSDSGIASAVKAKDRYTLIQKAVHDYDKGRLEESMEKFMEILRAGGTADEVALAKDYLNRITLKMGGHEPQGPAAASPVVGADTPPSVTSQTESILAGESPQGKQSEPPKEIQVTPEVLQEYYGRRFRSLRLEMYKKFQSDKNLQVIMKGPDKILALKIPYGSLFETGSNFKNQSKGILTDLVALAYVHPKHLIRIYPGFTQSRASLGDLQRATVLGGYLATKGITAERVEVELESANDFKLNDDAFAKSLANVLVSREGTLIIVFEEFADDANVNYFLTKYLPQRENSKEYPALALGVSRELLDTKIGDAAIIELFANSNPVNLAEWSLKIISAQNEVVFSRGGHSAILESFYFEGKKDAGGNFEFLPAGKYEVAAEALNAAGAKVKTTRLIEIVSAPEAPVSNVNVSKSAEPIPVAKNLKDDGKKTKHNAKGKKQSKSKLHQAVAKVPAVQGVTEVVQTPTKPAGEKLEGEVLTYKVVFDSNADKVPATQMSTLEQFARAAKLYPLQHFSIIGQASPEEKDSNNLARKRVENVAHILSSKYGLDRGRLNLTWAIGEKDKREVEIFVEE